MNEWVVMYFRLKDTWLFGVGKPVKDFECSSFLFETEKEAQKRADEMNLVEQNLEREEL